MKTSFKIIFGTLIGINAVLFALYMVTGLYGGALNFAVNTAWILIYWSIMSACDRRVKLHVELKDMYKKYYEEIVALAKENALEYDKDVQKLTNDIKSQKANFQKSISKKDKQLNDAQSAMQLALTLFKDVPGALLEQSDGSFLPNPDFKYNTPKTKKQQDKIITATRKKKIIIH